MKKELKTLKQLANSMNGEMDYNEVKAEAIKWVKAHKEQGHQTTKLMKYFHNITEEDLK